MKYLNEYHRKWMEAGMQSLERWKKNPKSFEQKKEQQARLDKQRQIRENRENRKN